MMTIYGQMIALTIVAMIAWAAGYNSEPAIPTVCNHENEVYSNLNVTEDDLINFIYEE